ncbi:hypothetical protein Mp_4g11740 [Marchantia polymorpha subsp. ruderalis]|uniref:Uncharacterized protein n=2 Tax=Marchantia polymorpha TaxID=3197 RepID=A0AAF6B8X8_MARPO|nr:hypothetical protein MARPO_0011s0159 [Marchantia polymorpha]BBN08462.1 hypothetical protein Mp_4g11740 [Marchantia polymorpha subsp. ruderalis]|eukprot:PTQ46498.1 hypothetical protein MARPO_0011s0159 [Marchantia polymorpha]
MFMSRSRLQKMIIEPERRLGVEGILRCCAFGFGGGAPRERQLSEEHSGAMSTDSVGILEGSRKRCS